MLKFLTRFSTLAHKKQSISLTGQEHVDSKSGVLILFDLMKKLRSIDPEIIENINIGIIINAGFDIDHLYRQKNKELRYHCTELI